MSGRGFENWELASHAQETSLAVWGLESARGAQVRMGDWATGPMRTLRVELFTALGFSMRSRQTGEVIRRYSALAECRTQIRRWGEMNFGLYRVLPRPYYCCP